MRSILASILLAGLSLALPTGLASAAAGTPSVTHLVTNGLENPLGTGDQAPQFSWQIRDGQSGAQQSAYRVMVASRPELLAVGKADVWDSGKVTSDRSIHVAYGGPVQRSATRYYWRVELWGKNGAAYPASSVSWWETGLLARSDWRANWIGAETEEHRLVRNSSAAWISAETIAAGTIGAGTAVAASKGPAGLYGFRYSWQLPETPVAAVLYLTARDSPSAWVNGEQILETAPQTPWRHMPWGRYEPYEIGRLLHSGRNTIAVGATVYDAESPSVSAVLLWRGGDGVAHLLHTGDPGWKSTESPGTGWTAAAYDDARWHSAPTLANGSSANELGRPWPQDSVNLLRKSFELSKPIRSARLYATALGAYEFRINGQPIGDQVLAPGWTDYRERLVYQVYDLTGLVHAGSNALGATLAPGWYSTPLMWLRQPYNYGNTPPALLAQLRVEYADGTVALIATDGSWLTHPSPVIKAEIYDGEAYDARLELPGWDQAAASSEGWKAASLIYPRPMELMPQFFEPIRSAQTFKAVSVTTPAPGVTVYDFGQNLAGVARLRVQAPAGTHIGLQFAEILKPDGTVYTENLRSAKALDEYIAKGAGVETFEPAFTFHGFRYVEVKAELKGLPAPGDKPALEAVALYTAAPSTVELTTGSPMLNKLWSNIEWGQRSNFVGVPTDCPQRDERLGWSADAQVFWRAASYNMNLESFSRKYAGDLRGTAVENGMFGIYAPGTSSSTNAVSAGWSDAGVIVPWTGWLQYGDAAIAAENWDAMQRYLDVIEGANPDHLWRNKSGIGFGDWLAPGVKTSNMLAATAYWAYDAELMAEMAHALGRTADEQRYQSMFETVRAAFQQRYVRPDGTVTGGSTGRPAGGDAVERATAMEADDGATGEGTQTGYALALWMRLVPETLREAAAEKMVALIHKNGDLLGTGFLGTPYILAALADTGHADLAYGLLLNTSYPSWGYQVEHGATTMWERWNGDKMMQDPGMNSFNHYAYGAVAAWIYGYAAGIDATPADPGYHTVRLHPNFSRKLGSVDFTYQSAYGPVHSSWKAPTTGPVTWKLTIPANASGSLEVKPGELAAYTLDGHPMVASGAAQGAGVAQVIIPAGEHVIRVALP